MSYEAYCDGEPDLSQFIEPGRIDDTAEYRFINASAVMRGPAAAQLIKPSQSPTFVHHTDNSSPSDGDKIFTPKSENFPDDQDELYNWESPILQHGQPSTSPQLAWDNAQDPIHDLFDEEIIYGDAVMEDVPDEPVQQNFIHYPQYQPMQFAQPMAVMPTNAPYMYTTGYPYPMTTMPLHPVQPMMLQQAVPPMLQHHQFMQGSVPAVLSREQRPVRQRGLLPAGPTVIKPDPSLSRRGVRNGKLSSQQRENTAETRKLGACWRCYLQRDICTRTESGCCKRCIRAAADSPSLGLPCNNTKLPKLVEDFLPPSMQNIHQKQSILDDVKKEVMSWQPHRTTLALSPGFGPDFTWTVYEFVPRSQNFLKQLQYFTDKETRQMVHREKYSPPLGVKSIGQEERQFAQYMETLLDPSLPHLQGYARQAYASEVEQEPFPEEVLDLLVILHRDTRDNTLRGILKKVLRLMILTFIMGHTLTIPQQMLPSILSQVRHNTVPPGATEQPHTSPRLANRQLKFYFSALRQEVYTELLKQGQNTLRARNKDETWLQAFVIILGLAMVSEEIQGVLHLQALGNIAKQHMDPEDATNQANGACKRIDDGFKLMVQLFQHKYRSDKWTSPGAFGNQTPQCRDAASIEFLSCLRRLVDAKLPYLEHEEISNPMRDGHRKYTSRLMARFLVPFTRLPEGGS